MNGPYETLRDLLGNVAVHGRNERLRTAADRCRQDMSRKAVFQVICLTVHGSRDHLKLDQALVDWEETSCGT